MACNWPFFCLLSLKIAFVSSAYVLYERGTCVNVKSETPCPVSGKIPAEVGWSYEYTNWVVRNVSLKDISDRRCKDALGAFLCTQSIPKCPDSDDDDLQALCKSAQNKCPDAKNRPKTCDDITRVKVNRTMKCVAVEETAVGTCPKQRHKMLKDDVQDNKYSARYFQTMQIFSNPLTSKPLFSSECTDNLKRAGCAARYCSDDEMRILVDYTREDCTRDTSCVVDRIKSLPPDDTYKLKETLQTYSVYNTAYCLKFPKASDAKRSGSADGASFHSFRLSLMFTMLITAILS